MTVEADAATPDADAAPADDAASPAPADGAASPASADSGEVAKIKDVDRDSLHILPLSILPIQTPALRRARMIKNVHLNSVIEFFEGVGTGSGQMEISGLAGEFGWDETDPPDDLKLLRGLELLPSYDVFSLRITLRELGVSVNDVEALKLSDIKTRELTSYMTGFSRPLISQIYGGDDMAIQGFDDIIALFRDPDMTKARDKLKVMAEKLEVNLTDIPKFLEDYGDIFMSLSYYRQCLDQIEPFISDFLNTMSGLGENWQLRTDKNLMDACSKVEATINEVMANITGRFENFDRSTENMWNDISAERFRKVEELIKAYHTTIGGVLCCLSVKMDAWKRLFPDKDTGGPVRRSEFIMSDMRQGLEKIENIENAAPMLAELDGTSD